MLCHVCGRTHCCWYERGPRYGVITPVVVQPNEQQKKKIVKKADECANNAMSLVGLFFHFLPTSIALHFIYLFRVFACFACFAENRNHSLTAHSSHTNANSCMFVSGLRLSRLFLLYAYTSSSSSVDERIRFLFINRKNRMLAQKIYSPEASKMKTKNRNWIFFGNRVQISAPHFGIRQSIEFLQTSMQRTNMM